MVWNLREVSLHHIIILPVKFRKIHIEKYMKMSLMHYFFLQTKGSRGEGSRGEGRGGDVRRVVFEGGEGVGEVCDLKHYISGPSFSIL